MTTKEWAEKLKTVEDIERAHKELAKDDMLVLCTESDDLIESYGIQREEFGAYNGTEVYVDQCGMHQYRLHNSFCVLVESGKRADAYCFKITPLTEAPYEQFDVIEYGEVYCKAVIFHKDDLPLPRKGWTSSEVDLAYEVIMSTLAFLKEDQDMDVDEIMHDLSRTNHDALVMRILNK